MSRWDSLSRELDERGIELERDAPLSALNTLAIGGPAAVLVRPRSSDQLLESLRILATGNYPFRCLGAGSNLLVDHRPLDFAVIALKGAAAEPAFDDEGVVAEGGVFLPGLARLSAERGLAGLEWAIGASDRDPRSKAGSRRSRG